MNLVPGSDKNEPGRFYGEGVAFRAKLIGVLEVPEARGDRMCQEALADLKMAIRAAGEHKQRIQIHVAIDGLRLRDDKTGDSLYHHPVHKISFIAQDMTDSRAFGYIFGSPDTGHRFFGIKTDKAASQVVIAMRDLFQVVFELKKKEIEQAKQQLEGKSPKSTHLVRHPASDINLRSTPSTSEAYGSKPAESTEGGVAELVDLEQELSSLRRGLTQVEGLTPSADPFGDSFTTPPPLQKGLLPPPPRGRGGPRASPSPARALPPDLAAVAEDFHPAPSAPPAPTGDGDVGNSSGKATSQESAVTSEATAVSPQAATSFDVFTELDPLGTGRSKPYVDKKLFFQELKNPPKKVLKDLVQPSTGLLSDLQQENRTEYTTATTMTSLTRQSGGSVSIKQPQNTHQSFSSMTYFTSDPFAETDPFDTDHFSESLKEDPFTNVPDLAKEKGKVIEFGLEREERSLDGPRGANGPLHVTLPPETLPKSPLLNRQGTAGRARPRASAPAGVPAGAMGRVGGLRSVGVMRSARVSPPPPPLPPKKEGRVEAAPALPPPKRNTHESNRSWSHSERRTQASIVRTSSISTNSSEEYLCPAPPPLPGARRLDITLAQLLTCTMPQLAERLHVPADTLSSMTLPQLTAYLRSYLAADVDRQHIHVDPATQASAVRSEPPQETKSIEREKSPLSSQSTLPLSSVKTATTTSHTTSHTISQTISQTSKIDQFEDNFAPDNGTFVANFDDFDKKANPSYDRYAVFREIQEQELKSKSILEPDEDTQENIENDFNAVDDIEDQVHNVDKEVRLENRSPLKTLDELTLDSFNMFRKSVSPKPTQIESKIEDIKNVMKNLQVEESRRSVSPKENVTFVEPKPEDLNSNDRYAALREITITEPQEEYESLPSDVSKERKKSDEKSDGFDNSDFFDCIDNSSLSFSHVEDAFRKSPSVKEKVEVREVDVDRGKEKSVQMAVSEKGGMRQLQLPPRLSTGSMSDVASASSPDTKDKSRNEAARWSSLAEHASPGSSDSRDSMHWRHQRASSSSSRDASPWEEEPRRPRSTHTHSRHNSSGSRDCLDSGSGREKEKHRDKRERDRDRPTSRDGRDSASTRERDRRDSDRRDSDRRDSDRRDSDRTSISKDRDHVHRRSDRMRDRDYSRERDYRGSRSRERIPKDYREKERDRDRHRVTHHSWDDEEDYSDGCSGRSSPRARWLEHRYRREERNYGSLGWRDSRRRNDTRQTEDPDRRYGSTQSWSRRSSSGASRRENERRRSRREESRRDDSRRDDSRRDDSRRDDSRRDDSRRDDSKRDDSRRDDLRRDDLRRDDIKRDDSRVSSRKEDSRRDERQRPVSRDHRFSNDFSPREQSPFENDFVETTSVGNVKAKRGPYSSLEGTRFGFEPEDTTASPISASSARRDADSTRFRFDSDSVSPRSLFEDDFTSLSTPRARAASIAEEEENELPPLRKPAEKPHKDIKKSDSVNIFVRENDPFENDDFFACTGSNKAARRENWPGDFQAFDNV